MKQAVLVAPQLPPHQASGRARPTGLATRDFDRVYRDPGRRLRSRHFLILARPAESAAGAARWGISVKARLGNAVVRNRIKRRLREILRGCKLPLAWDVVIQPRSAAVATAPFAGLRCELEDLLGAALAEKP